ncbi:MAG: electron transport complex subunit RsxB [Gammaproteobacteria bacterium]|jgi:electron transport complex protein RnfB|nr:electron transport complex subunit RsxB [Gammaproteobacteria bacterium]
MLTAVLALSGLALVFGLSLGYAAIRFRVEGDPLVEKIDALLPQTQCGQCGFPGCRPYASAIASGEADINQCPPGGETTILALADLLDRDPKPLNPDNGAIKPKTLAVIDEQRCIGCTLCIQACPVDAIVGAAKQMHTVVAAECTGCDLCRPPCPVDCIEMVPVQQDIRTWKWPFPEQKTAEHAR